MAESTSTGKIHLTVNIPNSWQQLPGLTNKLIVVQMSSKLCSLCWSQALSLFLLSFLNYTGAKFQKQGEINIIHRLGWRLMVAKTQCTQISVGYILYSYHSMRRNYSYKPVQAHMTSPGCTTVLTGSHLHNPNQLSDAETCTSVSLEHASGVPGEHRGAVVPRRGCSGAVCMRNKPKHNGGFYRGWISFWSGDAVPHLSHFI